MTNYRENTIDGLDREPSLVERFNYKIMEIEAELLQDGKDKIKEVITRRIDEQICSIKRYNGKKEPIFLSYQEIGNLEFKVAKKYIESLGFKASIHRGNYLFQRAYDKLYIYNNPIDIAPINALCIFFSGLISIILSLVIFDVCYSMNQSIFQSISFIFNKTIDSNLIVKSFFVGLYIIPIIILLIQTLFSILWKMYCFFSYLSFKSGVIKVNW